MIKCILSLRKRGQIEYVERYRSGHNEAVLKTVCPRGRVGSNPTLSALESNAGNSVMEFPVFLCCDKLSAVQQYNILYISVKTVPKKLSI